MTPIRKTITAVAAGLALTGGSVAVAAVGPLGLAGAQDDPAPVEQPTDTVSPDSSDDTASPEADETDADHGAEHGARLRESLQALVDDGTLTADQADAVTEHLLANRPDRGEAGPGHRGRVGSIARAVGIETIEEITGLTADEIRDGLANGQTLAELAGDSADELADAMIAEAEARIDAAVANGRIDADRAAEVKAELAQRVEDRLNGIRPERDGQRGPGGFDDEATLDA